MRFFDGLEVGAQPFRYMSATEAVRCLRARLMGLGVAAAAEHRTHDFRREHARDLQASKRPLVEILQAGEWRSPAFLAYLDRHAHESEAVLHAHLDESSDSE